MTETKNKKPSGRKLFLIFLLETVVVFTLFMIKLPYRILAPGNADDASKIVNVKKAGKLESEGTFYITSVREFRANLLLIAGYTIFEPHWRLIPFEDDDKNFEKDSDKRGKMFTDDSVNFSQIAAFKAQGYDVGLKDIPPYTEVLEIPENSPIKGILQVGDRIIKISGIPFKERRRLAVLLKDWQPGKMLPITIIRNDREMEVEIPYNSRNLGFSTKLKFESEKLPMDVQMNVKNYRGASAGLILALEVIRQSSGVDLTGGKKIAGTGEIDFIGGVYPVSGIRYKVRVAEEKGAEYFLSPEENYEEAKKFATKIKVIPVRNLKDALQKLKKMM